MTVPHPSDEALDAGLGGERGAALLRELRARVGAPGAAPMCVAPEAAPDPASRSRFVLLGEQAALLRLGRGGRPAQAAALEGALDQFRSARTIWLPRAACTGGAGVIGPDGARLPGQVVPLTRAEDVVALLLYLGGSGSDSAGGARRALPTTGSKAGWTPDLDLLTELSDPWRDDEPDSRAPRPERRTNATAQLPAPPPAAPELVSHGWGAHSTQLATRDAPQPANQVRGPGTAHASSLWHVAVQEHVASIPPPAPDPLAWARAGTAPAAAPEDDAAAHAARALLGVYSSATWLLGAGGGARLPAAVASAAEAAVRCGLLRTRLSALAAALARPSGNALCPARHALSTAVEAVLAEQAREVAELPETVLERRRGEAGTAASLGPVTLLETLTHGGALVADVECVARCLLVADGAGGAGQLDALLEASAVEAAERAAARLPRGGVLASYLHDAVSSAAPAHAGALAPLYAAVLAPCVASALWWATTAAPLPPHAAAVAACTDEALAPPNAARSAPLVAALADAARGDADGAPARRVAAAVATCPALPAQAASAEHALRMLGFQLRLLAEVPDAQAFVRAVCEAAEAAFGAAPVARDPWDGVGGVPADAVGMWGLRDAGAAGRVLDVGAPDAAGSVLGPAGAGAAQLASCVLQGPAKLAQLATTFERLNSAVERAASAALGVLRRDAEDRAREAAEERAARRRVLGDAIRDVERRAAARMAARRAAMAAALAEQKEAIAVAAAARAAARMREEEADEAMVLAAAQQERDAAELEAARELVRVTAAAEGSPAALGTPQDDARAIWRLRRMRLADARAAAAQRDAEDLLRRIEGIDVSEPAVPATVGAVGGERESAGGVAVGLSVGVDGSVAVRLRVGGVEQVDAARDVASEEGAPIARAVQGTRSDPEAPPASLSVAADPDSALVRPESAEVPAESAGGARAGRADRADASEREESAGAVAVAGEVCFDTPGEVSAWLPAVVEAGVVHPVCRLAASVGAMTVGLLRDHFDLRGHLAAARRYFFLLQGDWGGEFLSRVGAAADRGGGALLARDVAAAMDAAVADTCAAEDPFVRFLTAGLDKGAVRGDEAHARVIVASGALDALSCVQLHYSAPWPVNIILGRAAVARYNRALAFAAAVRRLGYLLDSTWAPLVRDGGRAPPASLSRAALLKGSSRLKKLHVFRRVANQIVAALQHLLLTQVTGAPLQALEASLSSARDLGELAAAHERYLDVILSRTLTHEKLPPAAAQLRRQVTALLQECLDAQVLIRGVLTASEARGMHVIEALGDAGGRWPPLRARVAGVHAQIEGLRTTLASLAVFNPAMEELLTMVDFTGFYGPQEDGP